MPEQTDIHGWVLPTPDQDEDWGIILNELFDDVLDREVVLYGQEHERPQSGAVGPRLFFNTTTEEFEFNDGTQWVSASGATAGATYVTTEDESADLTNAEQHATLSGTNLHDPSSHASSHESGESDELTHNNLSLNADDHHTKTTDASDLSDVSADSVSDAHHTKYADADAVGAVEAADPLELTGDVFEQGNRVATRTWANPEIDAEDSGTSVLVGPDAINFRNNLDVTDDGDGSVTVDASGGGTFSGSHDDLTDVSTADHHTKTTTAADLTDVSADSVSDAHHAKTQPSDIDSSNWNDYEIQKDGTDGAGVINFKTS